MNVRKKCLCEGCMFRINTMSDFAFVLHVQNFQHGTGDPRKSSEALECYPWWPKIRERPWYTSYEHKTGKSRFKYQAERAKCAKEKPTLNEEKWTEGISAVVYEHECFMDFTS